MTENIQNTRYLISKPRPLPGAAPGEAAPSLGFFINLALSYTIGVQADKSKIIKMAFAPPSQGATKP